MQTLLNLQLMTELERVLQKSIYTQSICSQSILNNRQPYYHVIQVRHVKLTKLILLFMTQ